MLVILWILANQLAILSTLAIDKQLSLYFQIQRIDSKSIFLANRKSKDLDEEFLAFLVEGPLFFLWVVRVLIQ